MGKERVVVTGGAGFIGSHLVDSLVKDYDVTVIDNLSTGFEEFVNSNADFRNSDIVSDDISPLLEGAHAVFHLAANADVSVGASDARVHLEQNIIATHNVLEAMRKAGVKKIVFSSSSTVYGRAPVPTPESYGPMVPESLYGASKLACEALICSYCATYGLQSWICRFANIIGKRSNHGVLIDFVKKLAADPKTLTILGDGKQNKSYMYVGDCVRAIRHVMGSAHESVNIFNLGTGDQVDVTTIAHTVSKKMNLSPEFLYTGGEVGWKGDIPKMLLSTKALADTGFVPHYTSAEAVGRAIEDILSSKL